MKSERRIWYNFVKLGINKTIGRINEIIGHVNKEIKYEESESNNKTTRCTDKEKKLWVCMLLRTKKRLRSHPKRKKRNGIVMFIYMNVVNYSALQPSNTRAQNR